jgi:hypothetical protein
MNRALWDQHAKENGPWAPANGPASDAARIDELIRACCFYNEGAPVSPDCFSAAKRNR